MSQVEWYCGEKVTEVTESRLINLAVRSVSNGGLAKVGKSYYKVYKQGYWEEQ